MNNGFITYIRNWIRNEDAIAASEFVLIFPVLFFMLIGIWDLGNGILTGQKLIAASQMVADLVSRNKNMTDDQLAETYIAGQLAMEPYDGSKLVIYIMSISYDDDGPTEVWHKLYPASAPEDPDVLTTMLDKAKGLAPSGGGTLAVNALYRYTPDFGQYVVGTIDMDEMAFSRGRRSSIVTNNN